MWMWEMSSFNKEKIFHLRLFPLKAVARHKTSLMAGTPELIVWSHTALGNVQAKWHLTKAAEVS